MSPRNVKAMCRVIRDTLVTLDPGHRAEYEANFRRYEGQLDELDRRIAAILAPIRGGVLFVYHPAFGYFCRDYGLRQEAVETEGKEPSSARLARLVDEARAKGVRVIFVQPQFAGRSAEALASAIGGAVVAIDPLPENYLREMETMARTIEQRLSAGR
jgi:zinc transport system substrate-binding protein